ncbi:MAG: LamG domain-containing protein, partial [Promethearchaeota archaeon]
MKKTLKNTKKFAFIAIFLMITTSSIYTNLISNGIIGDSLLSTPSTSSITHETTNVGYKYNISTWWNTTYKYRIGLEVENTEGFDRYQPVDVYLSFRPEEFYEGTGRLVSCNSTGNNYAGDVLWSDPLPVQVWNESKYSGTDYIHNCTITFIVNVSANSNITYFLYYNNNDDGIVTNKNYNTGFASNLWLDKLTVTVSNTEKYQVVLEKGYGVSDLIKDAVNLHSDDSLAPEKQLDHPDLKFLAHYDGSNVDITGNNPVVTLRGNEYYTDGVIQQAADFDGGSNWDYENGLEGAGDPFSDFSTEFTLTCWINPDSISSGATNHQTENVIAAKASDPYNDNFEIGVNVEGNIHIYLDTETRDTYADFGPAGAITAAGGWYFIACRYRDGVIDVRIDDTWYSNTATWSGATDIDSAAGSPFTIGASDHIDIYFNGQIDEVAVYNSYLSNADIENYKYCSSPSTINSITEIENGQVFSRYQVEWTTAFDMHATDICTFYYDYNLWNINRTI